MKASQGMKRCKYCKTEIPREAKVCPNCRRQQVGKSKWIIIGVIAFIVVCAALGEGDDQKKEETTATTTESSETTTTETVHETEEITEATERPTEAIDIEQFKSECQELDYKSICRNPDDYVGQKIVINVQIQQEMDGGFLDDSTYYRCNGNDEYDLWAGDEYIVELTEASQKSDNLLAEDMITVYGEFTGVQEVTRALTGTKDKVPNIKAVYIQLN